MKQKCFCGVIILLLSPSVRPARLVVYGSLYSDCFGKLTVIFKGIKKNKPQTGLYVFMSSICKMRSEEVLQIFDELS